MPPNAVGAATLQGDSELESKIPQCHDDGEAFPRHTKQHYDFGVVLMHPQHRIFNTFSHIVNGSRAMGYHCADGLRSLQNVVLGYNLVCLHRSYNCEDGDFLESTPDEARANGAPSSCTESETAPATAQQRAQIGMVPRIIHFHNKLKPWGLSELHRRSEAERIRCNSTTVGWTAWSLQLWQAHYDAFALGQGPLSASLYTSLMPV